MCSPFYAINVVFRYDDPNIEYDSVNSRVISLFIDKGIPLSIAMVPCDKNERPFCITDSIYWQSFCNPCIEVCLHGLTHQDINKSGEFGSLDYNETKRRIHKGINILQNQINIPIHTFIPPFNAINEYLPSVLKEEGISILSSDMFDSITTDNISYFPETLGHLMETYGIWNATKKSIFNNKKRTDVCVVMFHAYDLPNEDSWQELENILGACKIDKDIELHTFFSLSMSQIDGSKKRYNANRLEGLLQKKIAPKGLLLSSRYCYTMHMLNALLYVFWIIICIVPSLLLIQSKKTKVLILGLGLICSCIVFYVVYNHLLGPIKLLAIDGFVGILLLSISTMIRT